MECGEGKARVGAAGSGLNAAAVGRASLVLHASLPSPALLVPIPVPMPRPPHPPTTHHPPPTHPHPPPGLHGSILRAGALWLLGVCGAELHAQHWGEALALTVTHVRHEDVVVSGGEGGGGVAGMGELTLAAAGCKTRRGGRTFMPGNAYMRAVA